MAQQLADARSLTTSLPAVAQYSAAVIMGVAQGVGDLWQFVTHLDAVVQDAAQLLAEAIVIGSAHAPTPQNAVGAAALLGLCDALTGNRTTYDTAVDHMKQRLTNVQNGIGAFQHASGPGKVQMAARAVTNFVAPGTLFKAGSVLKTTLPAMPVSHQPVLFHNKPPAIPQAAPVKLLSAPEVKRVTNVGKKDKPLSYALVEVAANTTELRIIEGTIKAPHAKKAKGDGAHGVPRDAVAAGNPVLATGTLFVENGAVRAVEIDAAYATPHMTQAVKTAFAEAGFKELETAVLERNILQQPKAPPTGNLPAVPPAAGGGSGGAKPPAKKRPARVKTVASVFAPIECLSGAIYPEPEPMILFDLVGNGEDGKYDPDENEDFLHIYPESLIKFLDVVVATFQGNSIHYRRPAGRPYGFVLQ